MPMKTLILTVIFFLTAAVPSSGQSLKLPSVVFLGATAADWASTYRNIAPGGGHEQWPLNGLSERPKTLVAVGAGLDVAGTVAWNRFVGRRHPKVAAVGLYMMSSFRIWCAVRNTKAWNGRTR